MSDERSGELPVVVAVVKEGHRGEVTEERLLELLRKKYVFASGGECDAHELR